MGPRKRKLSTEYSTNPHTVKKRAQLDRMDENHAEYTKAKSSLRRQIDRKKNKLKEQADYQAASQIQQQGMVDQLVAEIEAE